MNHGEVVFPAFSRRNNCGTCNLSARCLGHGLDASALAELGRIDASTHLVRRGEHLFRTGDPFHALHVVRSGAVKTYAVSEDGEEQIIGFHLPGDIIGLNAIAVGHYVCNASSLDTSSICLVSFDDLVRESGESGELRRVLLGWMSRALVREQSMLLTLGRKNAEQRMAAFLVLQSSHHEQRGYSPLEFNLSMSRTDIGNYLGLAVETVSRVLTRFQAAGVLAVRRNRITVRDPDALQAFASGPGQELPTATERSPGVH